jgi:hypothetical protein
MQAAAPASLARKRDVDLLLRQRAREVRLRELGLPLGERVLEPLAQCVQGHSRLAVANLPQRLLQVALAAEIAHAERLELVRSRRARQRVRRLSLDCHGFQQPDLLCSGNDAADRPGSWRNGRRARQIRSPESRGPVKRKAARVTTTLER